MSHAEDVSLRVILGAGEQHYPGWIATQREQLDLCDEASWQAFFGQRQADALLCEHVWEHLSEAQGREAAQRCFRYLKPGGLLRVAVPDGNFPDAEYQRTIQVGGPGPADHPAADHKEVYTAERFASIFRDAGFLVELLEFCDSAGTFHAREWDAEEGMIYRSLRFDHRNGHGKLGFVSLILDARKPA